MRLRLVPQETDWNFFKFWKITFGASVLAVIASIVLFFTVGLNLGIDFLGGTTIRTESPAAVDVGEYRSALAELGLGDVAITEVFDPSFGPDENVAQVRIQAQEGEEAITEQNIVTVEAALQEVNPEIRFTSVESVGPEVSGELIWDAVLSVLAVMGAVLVYVWLRFEWQFSVGAVAALIHDVIVTIGIFCLLQLPFDLSIIAALLTIVGYSLNDTVVVFDRVRENLRKFKTMPLRQLMNLSLNETLSRTAMTSFTTLIALIALYILGGDVIRGFVFAMIWGIVIGTYSSVFVAGTILLRLGVKRDWSKEKGGDSPAGTQFTSSDA
ncbi:protein translocase subunit SecF [Roseicyclus sp. F158]|uniref:Protein-export membrane protein SecF n=1 Tax=Tropicimonas omnivorans TaxID=3075590 RepID=A0ABU3DGD2_9RHOB|nr:protein translocase subunit SecF [Roseicyclus sp. F158]MDT0682758.1 protein translocase subunit SecF [Roseicyclus sp. F158]